MMQGFYTGLSGLLTQDYGLSVVSDNLANVSTTGYKKSTAEFSTLFDGLIAGNLSTPTTNDVGYGVQLQATGIGFDQGVITSSDRFTDLSLEGNGFFGVVGAKNQYSYTRNGQFSFDVNEKTAGNVNSGFANLVTADGKYVAGTMLSNFTYNSNYNYGDTPGAYVLGNPTMDVPLADVGAQGKLEFPTRLAYPVEPTTKASFFGNLGATNESRTISADAISSTNEHNRIKLSFTQSAVQPAEGIAWDVVATVTSNDGSTTYDTQNGQAIFAASGKLNSFNIGSVNNDGTPVTLDLGTNYSGVISSNGIGVSGSSVSNGVAGGTLLKYGIDANGVIIGDFSNGRQSAIGRVAVYHFQNEQGLSRNGGTDFQETNNSGQAFFYTDANGQAISGATIRSGTLEGSNVRMEVGLTDMIIMQRAYQASAKSVTTADEMIQKALQMTK
jgi:flagellar hook protein FlgE